MYIKLIIGFLLLSAFVTIPVKLKYAEKEQGAAKETNADSAMSQTRFGVQPFIPGTAEQKVASVKNLGVTLVRTGITLQNFTGKDYLFDAYKAAGFDIVCNINWCHTRSPQPFPEDMEAYGAAVKKAIDAYPAELEVVENEELNKGYHIQDLDAYIAMINTAAKICHAAGLKVTNGGINGPGLYILVYRYLKTTHPDAANAFAASILKPGQQKYADGEDNNPEMESRVNDMKKLLAAYHVLDYVNWHSYEVFSPNAIDAASNIAQHDVVKWVAEYILKTTGRPMISNEIGVRNNTDPSLVADFLKEFADNNIKYVLYFNGSGGHNNTVLTDTLGNLNDCGRAFRKFVLHN